MIKRLKILFLRWQIKILLKKYHLSKNPIGNRRKKKSLIKGHGEADWSKGQEVAEILDNPYESEGKKKSVQQAAKEYYAKEAEREDGGKSLDDQISDEYRTHDPNEKWPGHRMGD